MLQPEENARRITASAGGTARLLACAAAVLSGLGLDAAADDGKAVKLDEIVVTAQKRPELEQQVPVAISVVGEKQLETVPPTSSNAYIARLTPNFNYVELGGQAANTGNIRGVGSLSPIAPNDSSISYNIDEIPQSAYGIQPSTLDIARVEVLRGPQGTLYGLNSQAGAVNYVPNRPFFGHAFTATGEVGSRGWGLGEIVANETLVDNVLAGRLALRYTGRNGDFGNAVLGGKDGHQDIGAVRGTFLLTPRTDTRVIASFAYNRSDDSIPRYILSNAPCYPCDGLNPRPSFKRENKGGDIRIEHTFDAFNFTSLSSIQDSAFRQDLDMTDSLVFGKLLGVPSSTLNTPGQDEYFSTIKETRVFQEFRATSLPSSKIAWTTGINFFRSDALIDTNGQNFSIPNFLVFSGKQNNRLQTNNYAAFGDATVPIFGGLKGILGLRMTHADTDASFLYGGGGVSGTVDSYSQTSLFRDTYLTGRAGLTYDVTPRFFTYATVGRGAVGGGYAFSSSNTPTGTKEPFYPTSLSLTYEAGFKSTLIDGRMTLNGAAFYNDVKNGHLYVFNRTLLTFQPAVLDSNSYGGEIETRIQVTPELSMQGGLGFTRAVLQDVPLDTPTGAVSGYRVPNVPQISASVGGEYRIGAYRFGLPAGELYANAFYEYVGVRAADVGNDYDLPSYGLVNARIGWDRPATKVYVFGTNIFDQRYQAVGTFYGAGVQAVTVGLGRIVGVGATFSF